MNKKLILWSLLLTGLLWTFNNIDITHAADTTKLQTTVKESITVDFVNDYTKKLEAKFDVVLWKIQSSWDATKKLNFYKKAYTVFFKVNNNIQKSKMQAPQKKLFKESFDRMLKILMTKLTELNIKVTIVWNNPVFSTITTTVTPTDTSSNNNSNNNWWIQSNWNTLWIDTSILRNHDVHTDWKWKESESLNLLNKIWLNMYSYLSSKDVKAYFWSNFSTLFWQWNGWSTKQWWMNLFSNCKFEPKWVSQITDFADRFKMAVWWVDNKDNVSWITANLLLSNLLDLNNKFRLYYVYGDKSTLLNTNWEWYSDIGQKVWIALVEHQEPTQAQFYIMRDYKKIWYNAVIMDSNFQLYQWSASMKLLSNNWQMHVPLYNNLPIYNCTL